VERIKPKWLRRLHVNAHQGYSVVNCPLCNAILDQAVIDACNSVADQLRNLRSE